jgi:hypothetical protein
MVKTKRIPQLKSATALYDNDLILVEQENVTKKATFKLFKDTVGSGGTGTGSDAREIELRNSGAYLQWRYVGVESWIDLVSLEDITGPAGSSYGSTTYYFVGDGVKKTFNPVPGLVSTDSTKCLVIVGGVPQVANVSYNVNLLGGGTLNFIDEAPPAGLTISIQSFQ